MGTGKVYEHDIESYIITIRRKGTVATVPVTAAPMPEISASAPAVKKTSTSGKAVVAPLPGVIVALKVNVGDVVKTGQVVVVLEAMKMENEIQAECDGKVIAVNVSQGDSVPEGSVIVVIE